MVAAAKFDSAGTCGPASDGSPESKGSAGTVVLYRRRDDGSDVDHLVLLIPLLADGKLDWDARIAGQAFRTPGPGGIGVQCESRDWKPAPGFLIGVGMVGGIPRYEGFEVRHLENGPAGQVRVGGVIGGIGHELLRSDNLVPALDPETLRFRLRFPAALLPSWTAAGILLPVEMDRVEVCPKCQSLPSFRPGCRKCGSARTTNQRFIHHFPCAHVGEVSDFEAGGGELVCPKCRTRKMVVGADFEYLTGPYVCLECHWTDTELEQVGQCLRCAFRFPLHEALVEDLVSFHVNRLDSLAFLAHP